jgi:hypothetical protein
MKFTIHSIITKVAKCLICYVIGILAFSSCVDDEYDFDKASWKYTFNPKLALTIGNTTFRIDSVLNKFENNEYIHSTDSGLIYIVYDKDLQFYKGGEKFSISKTQGNINLVLNTSLFSFAVYPASGKVTIDTTINYPVTFGTSQRIDSMALKNMILQMAVNSTVAQPGKLVVSFPGIAKQNVQLKDSFDITALSFNETHTKNGAGHKLKFKNVVPGTSDFQVRITYTLTGTPGTRIGPGQLSFNLSTSNIEYTLLYGYLGQENLLNITDTIDLSIFNNDITDRIEWKDPNLTLFLNNSYVVLPIRLNINNVSVISRNNTIYNINLSPNPVDLKYPKNGELFMKDTLVYTKSNNPNLFNAIEKTPKYLRFHVDAFSNPRGDEGLENIIKDTSTIRIKSHFYLPLWFRSGEFGTVDTMDFNLRESMGDNLDSIESMLFRIVSENGMPIDMHFQVYFTDNNYFIIDSIFHNSNNKVLSGGKVGSNDRVISPVRSVLDIKFTKEQLKALLNTKKMLVRVYANTVDYSPVNGKYVKFFTDYKFKLSFACQFQAKFSGYLNK